MTELTAKMAKGVAAMEELYECKASDCARILSLMESSANITCEWTPQEVQQLYHDYGRTRLDPSGPDEDDLLSTDKMDKVSNVVSMRGKAGYWYVMKPEDESSYWIGRAVMVDHAEDEGKQCRGVRMEYWEPVNPRSKKMNAKHYPRAAPNSSDRHSRCSTHISAIVLFLSLCLCHMPIMCATST